MSVMLQAFLVVLTLEGPAEVRNDVLAALRQLLA